MHAARPTAKRAIQPVSKRLCRFASHSKSQDKVVWNGIHREANAEFSRPPGPYRTAFRNSDRGEPEGRRNEYLDPRDRHEPRPEYYAKPRRMIMKADSDSEWIFGTSVVEAALKTQRRKLYRLYIYTGGNRTPGSKERDIKLKNLARGLRLDIKEVADLGMLDSMSDNRPHNGYVLEASPLVKTPVLSLAEVSPDKSTFALQKTQHDITGTGVNISELPTTVANRDPRQYPFLLMLDEILDPGNLGAILRTAYFLGCSALVVSERNCAPLSPTCLKTSAGASEHMPILTQVNPVRFISASQQHGWKFFAAVPPTGRTNRKTVELEDDGVRQALKKGPTVLVMGSEGEGLRETVKKACDKWVSIQSAKDVDKGVDSLNVSVAAGVLCRNFLMKR